MPSKAGRRQSLEPNIRREGRWMYGPETKFVDDARKYENTHDLRAQRIVYNC